MPAIRRKPQPSRASRVGGNLLAAGKLASSRLGGSSSKSRTKPGLAVLAGAGAGAAALAARKRRSNQRGEADVPAFDAGTHGDATAVDEAAVPLESQETPGVVVDDAVEGEGDAPKT